MSDNEDNSEKKKSRPENTNRESDSDDLDLEKKRPESRRRDRDYDRKRADTYSDRKRTSPEFDRKTEYRRRDDRQSDRGNYKDADKRDYRDSYRRRDDKNDQGSLRRYWDIGRKNENKYRDNFDSDEEVEVGERFYGGKRDNGRNSRRGNETERRKENEPPGNEKPQESKASAAPKRSSDMLTSKTGGAYIPPAKLRMMQAEISDKSGAAYQRIAWEALKKSIHGHINKVNTSNIGIIVRELLKENIVRGRGLLTRSIMQAQAASPTFTHVYAALTAVINARFPIIGELIVNRLLNQFKRGYRRNDKPLCISSGTFIAHLVNQRVAHELIVLQMLMLLTENVSDDSIEITIAILKECGMRLLEVAKKSVEMIFSNLRRILHEGEIDKRVQYMIEVIFHVRKDGFKDHEAIPEGLDLVDEEEQSTILIDFEETVDSQDILNVFQLDPNYIENEEKYKKLMKEILDTDSSESDDAEDGDESSDEETDAEEEAKQALIIDNTETNLTALRRTIYLTIHSSLDFEECAHKLLKMQLKPGQEIELCHMILDCCAENRTYEKFFGLLAGRFCAINRIYVTPYEQIFRDSYDTIYRLDTNKLRNVANFFAHLFCTDSISWEALSCIKLNENDTNSSGRVFIKILFQKLSEEMTLPKLNERFKDPTFQEAFSGLFPRDDPRNTRFSINFFTTIGLGGLTDDLREHLESRPKPAPVPQIALEENDSSDSDSSSSSSSSSSSTSSSSSSESSDSSDDSSPKKKRKKKASSKKQESMEKGRKTKRKKDDDDSDSKENRHKRRGSQDQWNSEDRKEKRSAEEIRGRKNIEESRNKRNRVGSRERRNRDRRR